jgi:hypothetical protein
MRAKESLALTAVLAAADCSGRQIVKLWHGRMVPQRAAVA